jgi:hypothetical protein
VLIFFNDTQVGSPSGIPFVQPNGSIEPALYVGDGGIVLSVRNWRVSLF